MANRMACARFRVQAAIILNWTKDSWWNVSYRSLESCLPHVLWDLSLWHHYELQESSSQWHLWASIYSQRRTVSKPVKPEPSLSRNEKPEHASEDLQMSGVCVKIHIELCAHECSSIWQNSKHFIVKQGHRNGKRTQTAREKLVFTRDSLTRQTLCSQTELPSQLNETPLNHLKHSGDCTCQLF